MKKKKYLKRSALILLTFVLMLSCVNSVYAAYSHTIPMDQGTNFNGDEIFTTSTSNYYTYTAWDNSYLYIAYNGAEVNKDNGTYTNQNNKWVQMYIGGSGGTNTGVKYNSQQPTLPFKAKYHLRWKVDETYANVQMYNGSSWVNAGWNMTTYRGFNNEMIKFKIPLASIGNPKTLQFASFMLEETSLNERMWAAYPASAFVDGYKRNVSDFTEFDLTSDSAPLVQAEYNFKNTAVTGNTASFSFNSSPDATSVRIQQSTDGGSTWTNSVTAASITRNSTTAKVTGLTPSTTYKFRLVVTGGTNAGSSTIQTVTTSSSVPVSNFAATSVSDSNIGFSWSGVSGATNLMIEQSIDGITWTTANTGAIASNAVTATARGLTPSTTYHFRLVVTGGANSGNSNQVIASTTADRTVPSVPTGLTASNITMNSFKLNWNASVDNVGVKQYEVFRNGISIGKVTGTTMNVSGLMPSTSYTMTVRAGDAEGNWSAQSSAVNVKTLSDNTPPSVPTGLNASNVTDNSFTLNWSAAADNVGVSQYEVFRNGISLGRVTGTSMEVTGLSPSTDYNMTVRAGDAAGNWSAQSSALNVKTSADDMPPSTPSGLNASDITSIGFTLNWSTSTDNVGVTEYEVFQNDVSLGFVTGTNMEVTDLTPSTSYTMTVRARDAEENWSEASTGLVVTTGAASIETDTTSPSIPGDLNASGITDSAFTLNWSASTDDVGVTRYEVSRDGNPLGTVTGTSMEVTGLTPSTSYTMTVRARDAEGNWSGSSAGLAVTTAAAAAASAPSIPSDLNASHITDSGFTLSWSASTDEVGVTEYEVFQDGNSLGTVTGTTINVTGLTPSTSYGMTVKAGNAAGKWSESSIELKVITEAPAATPDTAAPSIPSGLNASDVTDSAFTLNWSASTDNVEVTQYEVLRDGVSLGIVAGTSLNVSDLNPSTDYEMTVKAGDAAGNWSESSTGLKVTTEAAAADPDTTPPSIPENLDAWGITDHEFTLSWSPSTDDVGATKYEVLRDGVSLGIVTGTSTNVSGLEASTDYEMTVKAGDAAGNWSESSTVLTVTTEATPADSDTPPPLDLIGPDVPGGLHASDITVSAFTLSWSTAADNVGVTQYKVYQDGSLIDTVTGTSMRVTGLSPSTSYSMTVSAGDAADNWSIPSPVYQVRTLDPASVDNNPSPPADPPASDVNNPTPPADLPAPSVPATPAESPQKPANVNCKVYREANRIIIDGCLNESGRAIEVTLGTSVLNGQLDQVLVNEGYDQIIFDILQKADEYKISIPWSLVQHYSSNSKVNFEVKMADQRYQIPWGMISDAQIGQKLGTDSAQQNLTYHIRTTNEQENLAISSEQEVRKFTVVQPLTHFSIYTDREQRRILYRFEDGKRVLRIASPTVKDQFIQTTGAVLTSKGRLSYAPWRRVTPGSDSYQLFILRNNSLSGVIQYTKSFDDISTNWGKNDIEMMASKLVVMGENEKVFNPDKPVTRAEFAALLVRIFGLEGEASTKQQFMDTSSGAWYYAEVQSAALSGIIKGYGNGKFGPDQRISREEMAAMISRVIQGQFPESVLNSDESSLNQFKDAGQISTSFHDDAAKLVNARLMEGYPNHEFRPKAHASRVESVTLIRRLLQYIRFL
ncbi:fibronectin type III domain-containing protein [Paenibacillus sp. YPG26]|uniref:fibronectin type III domain-containing protein n=1 Tax=Paenibacillus sp. YPG26 TaxID=2878915 RepID=UPI00203EE2D2|nr:fibronectin type III domain-containing protein [Paenibacillus sp. YPG26]USB32692.1 fibronectin type III domain-containing protein [Paenibacillus sp. YPG26]